MIDDEDEIIPSWAEAVSRSVNMIEGSEEHTAWKLKYQSIEEWWRQLVEEVTKED